MNPRALSTTSKRAFAIEDLMSEDSFPHRVERLELRETHVSWIVLTGPYAYKIKKPVKLDFIDASTLERRYQLCLEELRLNAQLALDLYLDVVAITRREGGLRSAEWAPRSSTRFACASFPLRKRCLRSSRPIASTATTWRPWPIR